MDKDLITAFKAYDIRKAFFQAVKITGHNEEAPTLKEFWRS
jgi:hypothetical protein